MNRKIVQELLKQLQQESQDPKDKHLVGFTYYGAHDSFGTIRNLG